MAVGNIDAFWSQLSSDGIAKNSHWDAWINLPAALVGSEFSGMDRTLSFRCEAGELPGRQLVTNDVKIYGPIYRTPYQSLYTELNLTFLETQDLQVRRFMEAWMDAIFDSSTNVLRYQDSYETSMILTQYRVEPRDQQKPASVETGDLSKLNQTSVPPVGLAATLFTYIHRAYPVNINQMSTAWSDDSAHRVQVTFFYEWYTMAPALQPTAGRYQGLPESTQTVNVPVGLDDTTSSWFSRTLNSIKNTVR